MRAARLMICCQLIMTPPAFVPVARGSDLASDFLSCADVGKAASRLACYDRVAAGAKPIPQAERPDFTPGKPLHVRDVPPEVASVTVGLASTSTTDDGKPVFRLVNGQVWQGEDDDPVYPEPAGNVVTISEAALGIGYHLRMNRETREIVVRRVQ